jgi:hypothetical protein
MSEQTEIEKSTLSIGTVSKIVVVLISIGGAWLRFEHKMDEQSERILKKIDEHILADKFEKQILESKVVELTQRVQRAEEYAEQFVSKEFIRPSETKMEKNRRKNN